MSSRQQNHSTYKQAESSHSGHSHQSQPPPRPDAQSMVFLEGLMLVVQRCKELTEMRDQVADDMRTLICTMLAQGPGTADEVGKLRTLRDAFLARQYTAMDEILAQLDEDFDLQSTITTRVEDMQQKVGELGRKQDIMTEIVQCARRGVDEMLAQHESSTLSSIIASLEQELGDLEHPRSVTVTTLYALEPNSTGFLDR